MSQQSRFSTRSIEGTDDDLQVWDDVSGHVISAATDEAEQFAHSLNAADMARMGNPEQSLDFGGYTVHVTGDTASVEFSLVEPAEQIAELDLAAAEREAAEIRDAALRDALADFATWPTKPQAIALEGLVAAHKAVRTWRVTVADGIDYLRVTWGSSTWPEYGALIDAVGEIVEPSDPTTVTLGLPLQTIAGILSADTLTAHLETLRERARARGELASQPYAVDSAMANDVIAALNAAAETRGRVVEFLAAIEASVSGAPAGALVRIDAPTLRSLLADMLPA